MNTIEPQALDETTGFFVIDGNGQHWIDYPDDAPTTATNTGDATLEGARLPHIQPQDVYPAHVRTLTIE